MAFCSNCGASIEAGAKFCPGCGAKLEAPAPVAQAAPSSPVQPTAPVQPAAPSGIEDAFEQFNNTADSSAAYDPADIAKGKGMSVLAYLGILVVIPLLVSKDSPYVRFHTNQGLVLCIVEIVWNLAYRLILGILGSGFLYRLVGAVGTLVGILFFVYLVLGIVNACKGKAKELPIIGQFRLLK